MSKDRCDETQHVDSVDIPLGDTARVERLTIYQDMLGALLERACDEEKRMGSVEEQLKVLKRKVEKLEKVSKKRGRRLSGDYIQTVTVALVSFLLGCGLVLIVLSILKYF